MRPFRPRNTPRARELRREATPAERHLWRYLARGALGVKFSRQMPLGPYFADFLCREHRLIVELDGFSHESREAHDAARTRWLEQAGYRVLRFTNRQALEQTEGVLLEIRRALGLGAQW
jgi:BirA family biotin operon repressor/biotin-[acetyl-CoA-carboxylase] ligase